MLRIWFNPLQKVFGDIVKAPEDSDEGENEESEDSDEMDPGEPQPRPFISTTPPNVESELETAKKRTHEE